MLINFLISNYLQGLIVQKKFLLSLVGAATLLTSVTGCTQSFADNSSQQLVGSSNPKNIIMVVADGMGPAYPAAYRYFADNPETALVEETIFDQIYVGNSSTYPAADKGTSNLYVTDSAASATSLATGVKTYNGAIGVDLDKKPHITVLEWAKTIGKRTGIAVTSQIVHATPASYIAKNESRRNYNAIADDYFDKKLNGRFKVDVMLGGGTDYFIRDDRDLSQEFQAVGYQYIDQFSQLSTLTPNTPVLGLFAPVSLAPQLDTADPHRLKTLTEIAVKQLENKQGYFLLVEASQIDWGGHSNDIAYAMGEMQDLAATMQYLKQYVDNNPDTLVVLTADHNTGGFSIGAKGNYKWQPRFLENIKASSAELAKKLVLQELKVKDLNGQLGFELTESEINHFATLQLETQHAAKQKALTLTQAGQDLGERYYKHINSIIDNRTDTGWTSSGHTGVDVPVYAFGQGYEHFIGYQDNIEIAEKLFRLMGK